MSAPTDGLLPVLVAGGGRNGTTLIMQLLATSPQVAFDRGYPYEHRYLTYLLRLCQVTRRREEPTEEWNAVVMTNERTSSVGAIPWRQAMLLTADRDLGEPFWLRLFRAAWSEFSSAAIASMQRRFGDGIEVTHYAEKAPDWVVAEASELLPAKRLYPVRDPRDQFLSILAFNEKRGWPGFGQLPDDTPETFARRFAAAQRRRLARLAEVDEGPDDLLVRYERMIEDPAAEAGRIAAVVGVPLDAAEVVASRQQFAHHMTSSSAQASVARWKHQMEPEIRRIFADAAGEQMAAFGYEV
jgi:hypothetical protein